MPRPFKLLVEDLCRRPSVLIVCAFLWVPLLGFACDYVEVVEGSQKKARWCLTVARSPEAHRQGLQGVKKLKPDSGMLFIFERPTPQFFWMKDTPLSLDLIFADSSGIISKIIKNAKPNDETILAGGCAQYVVEVGAGTSAAVEVGDRLIFKNLPATAGKSHGKENHHCL